MVPLMVPDTSRPIRIGRIQEITVGRDACGDTPGDVSIHRIRALRRHRLCPSKMCRMALVHHDVNGDPWPVCEIGPSLGVGGVYVKCSTELDLNGPSGP